MTSSTDQRVAPGFTPTSSVVLGKLERIDARTVWKYEAHNFTPWLQEHVGLLAEALGIEIESVEREVGVGDFNVDLVGRVVGGDRPIIIENQLARTDHSHLGQLLTYAAGKEAAYIVWVTPQFHDEHRRALDWLNEVTCEGVSFFGIEIELLRIVDSAGNVSLPAPHFKLVAQPNDWQKQACNVGGTGAVTTGSLVLQPQLTAGAGGR